MKSKLQRQRIQVLVLSAWIAVSTVGCTHSQKNVESDQSKTAKEVKPTHERGFRGDISNTSEALKQIIKQNKVKATISELTSLTLPAPSELELLAGLYLCQNDFRKAQSTYLALSAKQPDNANALVKAGFCAMVDSRQPEGVALLRRAADAAKSDIPSLTALGIIFVDLGRGKDAAEVAEKLLRIAPDDPDALAVVAHVRQGFRDYTDAESWYQKALNLDPQHYFAQYYLAQVYRDSGQYDKAKQLLLKLAKQAPKSGWPHAQLGYNCVLQGKFAEALSHYKKAVEVEPTDPILWSELGHMYMRVGNLDEATTNYGKAVKLKPGIRSASSMLIPLYAISANEEKQLNLLRKLSGDNRQQIALQIVSIDLKASRGLKQKRPDNLPFPWIKELNQAETESLNNDEESAEQLFKQALVKSGNHVLARYIYATHLLRSHHEAEAASEFRELSKQLPDNAAILAGLALSLAKSNQLKGTSEIAHKSISIHPTFRAWYAIALIANAQGHTEEELFALRAASRLRAFDPRLELDLSQRLTELGDETQSKAAMKPLLDAEPEQADVWLDVMTNYSD